MRPRVSLLLFVLVPMLLGGATVADAPREVLGLSEHGSVLGPMVREGEPDDPEAKLGTFVAGLEAMGRQEYEKAAELFDRVAEATGWPEAAYNASLAWYAAGRYDLALQRADRIGEALPDDTGVMYLRGVLLQAVGRHEDATAVIQRSLARSRELERRVDEAVGLLNLGASARLLGRPDDAIAHFRAARELGAQLEMPTVVAAAWMGEGNVHLAGGDRAAADAALSAARRLGKERGFGAAAADADLSLAAVALSEGRTDKAKRLLDSARLVVSDLEIESVRASMLLTIAQLQRELGEREAAVVSLEEAMRLFLHAGIDVGRAHVLVYRGGWALEDHDLPAAERLLEEARAIQVKYQVPLALAETHLQLASLRAGQHRLDEALGFAQQAVDAFAAARAVEAERGALVVLAGIRSERGELAEARLAALRAIELAERVGDATEAHHVRSELAIIDAAAGAMEDALAHLAAIPRAVFAALPRRQRMRVQLQLAWGFHRAQRYEEAEARGRLAVDLAADGDLAVLDLASGARDVYVYALLDGGRIAEAEVFLATLDDPTADLAAAIAGRRLTDTFNAAVEALNSGDAGAAVDLFGSVWSDGAVEESRRETVGRALASALRGHAYVLNEAGELEAAASAFARSAVVASQIGDVPGQARALVDEAGVRAAGGDEVGAGALATKAAELAESADDRKLAGDCWMIAGQALFETDARASRAAFVRALEAWGTSPETLGSRASVTYNLAVLEYNTGVPADARVRLEEARVLATQAGLHGLVDQVESLTEALAAEE